MKTTDNKRITIAIITFIILSLILISCVLQLIFMFPSIKDLYLEFSEDVPLLTIYFIKIGECYSSFWYITIPLTILTNWGISKLAGYYLSKLSTKTIILIFISSFILLYIVFILFIYFTWSLPLKNLFDTTL